MPPARLTNKRATKIIPESIRVGSTRRAERGKIEKAGGSVA